MKICTLHQMVTFYSSMAHCGIAIELGLQNGRRNGILVLFAERLRYPRAGALARCALSVPRKDHCALHKPYATLLLMDGLLALLPLVIDLGDFSLSSVTPLGEVAWFIGGLLLLAGSSAAILWWNRRARTDPFA